MSDLHDLLLVSRRKITSFMLKCPRTSTQIQNVYLVRLNSLYWKEVIDFTDKLLNCHGARNHSKSKHLQPLREEGGVGEEITPYHGNRIIK